jgi:hypothetical protein
MLLLHNTHMHKYKMSIFHTAIESKTEMIFLEF